MPTDLDCFCMSADPQRCFRIRHGIDAVDARPEDICLCGCHAPVSRAGWWARLREWVRGFVEGE